MATADPAARGPPGQGVHQTYRILKFFVGSFGLDSNLLTDCSILRYLGLTLLIIIGGGGLRLVIYATGEKKNTIVFVFILFMHRREIDCIAVYIWLRNRNKTIHYTIFRLNPLKQFG